MLQNNKRSKKRNDSRVVLAFLNKEKRVRYIYNLYMYLHTHLTNSKTKSSDPTQKTMQRGGKIIIANIVVVAASAAAISAAMVYFYRRRRPRNLLENQVVVPLLDRSESGRVARIERFSNYVARQLGIEDASECPQLGKLTYEYIKNPKECDCLIYEYFANEPNAEELYVKLVEELERCVLAYFAFHWSQVTITISQVLGVDADQKRLKDMVMTATRKQRFQKVAKDLKVTRMFSTLVEEIKAIGGVGSNGDSQCTEVMVPAKHSERSPVLLLMGGGMGAGKSTVLKDILKEPFWAGAAANAVVVEADAFKETDVIYRALSSRGHHQDMLPTSELVHQSSTDAASSLLVTALNEGRDVIMDGTLSWEPFVEQTVAMARSVHKHRYRMGVGYKVEEDGTIVENYWEKVEDGEQVNERKPYRIELVGVVCDAYLAVVRGIRRAIQTGRAVRVKPQLKSHKRFANAFPKYCHLVDNVKLFCTNAIASPPMLIAWKDGGNKKLLVEPDEIKCLKTVANLNEEAESVYDLHNTKSISIDGGSSSVFNEIVMQPSRPSLQLELKTAVLKIENQIQG